MKLSVIIPTLSRKTELVSLLNSLSEVKKYKHEIIIVDQNFNNLLDSSIETYSNTYNIIHYKVDFRNLSKAKNFGIERAKGEYICFPDDDSKLFQDTIFNALNILDNQPAVKIVFGKCIDEFGNDSVIKFNKDESELSLKNFEGNFIEATMFARTSILKNINFDENLGIGSFYGAEEGFDLIYRLLKTNHTLYYNPNIRFYHPQPIKNHSNFNSIKRVFEYRKGFSYVCLKHKMYKKLIMRILLVSGNIPLTLLIARNKSRYYCAELLGLLSGIIVKEKC